MRIFLVAYSKGTMKAGLGAIDIMLCKTASYSQGCARDIVYFRSVEGAGLTGVPAVLSSRL
jgi:hypothetical protein